MVIFNTQNVIFYTGIFFIIWAHCVRLKDPRVKPWLPSLENLSSHHDELKAIRTSLLNHSKAVGTKKLLKEAEQDLLKRLKSISRKDQFNQIANSKVVTSTCLTAMQWPSEILQSFDLICIDEAAFAPDWLTLPLVLSGIPRVILAGDHFQACRSCPAYVLKP